MTTLEFLYTGAKVEGEKQVNPQISLGGFVSGSTIPNGQVYNLFSDLALLSQEIFNVKAAGLTNATSGTSAKSLNNIRMWFSNKNLESFFHIEIAIVTLVEGEMQLLDTPYSVPYGVTFNKYYLLPTSIATGNVIPEDQLADWPEDDITYDPDSQHNIDNVAVIGDMIPGQTYGIWFKRIIDRDALRELFKCSNLYEEFQKKEAAELANTDYDPPYRLDSGVFVHFDFDEEETEDGAYLKVKEDSKVIVNP